jgi:hypothetical protein
MIEMFLTESYKNPQNLVPIQFSCLDLFSKTVKKSLTKL